MAKTNPPKIEEFTDLKTWQEAHSLSVKIFKKIEQDGIHHSGITAVQNNSLDVTHNIARGFYKRSFEEKITIYYSVLDSLVALNDNLQLMLSLEIIDKKTLDELQEGLVTVRKMTFSLINKLKEFLAKDKK